MPLAIEQDLCWYTDPDSGESRSVVAHEYPLSGKEPTLRDYFFERVRPLVEDALAAADSANWPLIVLNLDIKEDGRSEQHLEEILNIVGEYGDWITSASRVVDETVLMPLQVRPLLVLAGSSEIERRVFHDELRPGQRLLLFGGIEVSEEPLRNEPVPSVAATNYRRWWNNSWEVVEPEGQTAAGDWTKSDEKRLRTLVEWAHQRNLWVRFYTLNGHPEAQSGSRGWSAGYNFGSLERVRVRWKAALEAGVDFIATDQYEEFSQFRGSLR